MELIDTSGYPRIPIFVEMARRMSSARKPNDVLAAYINGMRNAYGNEAYVRVATAGLPPGQFRVIRIAVAGEFDEVSDDEIGYWQSFPIQADGFLADIVRTPEPKLIRNLYLAGDPVLGDRLSTYESAMAVPMYIDGSAAQWLVLLYEAGVNPAPVHLEESVARVNMLSSNIRTSIIARELQKATRWIKNEVETIAGIQRALLPPRIPSIPGLEGAAHYETFDRAGGDYYDFRPLRMQNGNPDPGGPWALIVADAAGHGPAAAVVMAMLRTLFHGYERASSSPANLLEHLNHSLNSESLRFAFVTAFAGIYDPETRILRYARAGHEPPFVLQGPPSGGIRRLDAVNGFPLGVNDRVDSGEAAEELAIGETLVLYTDGVTDALSPDGEMFRVEGVERALFACDGAPDHVIAEVIDAMKAHEAGSRPRDDQTLVALRVVNH